MGQFYVTARLTGPTGSSEQVRLPADTGATFLVLPRPVADRLGAATQRTEPVMTAGGREDVWPVGEVRVAIEGREVTTPCFIPASGPALLGAVPLESLLLVIDPVARRLVPTRGLVL
ncbi:MAG: aspartyl protease family protein [Candidatus Rokuibacteriota bacterium]